MVIIVAEKISPRAIELLQAESRWNIITPEQVEGNLATHIAEADALIVRSAVQVDAELLEKARKLRVIGRAGIGVDNIDQEAATRKGIAVLNTPGANAVAVAEHTFALALAMARHVCRASSLMKAGKWEKKSLQGTELRGKTLGIVGLGRIGMEVGKRGTAFGMKVMAHDPYLSPQIAREAGFELSTLDSVLGAADYLTLHLALTPQSAGMINSSNIAKMKKGVRLINCARGELIDEAALAQGLRSGQVGGAALDVFAHEPPKDSPLMALDNVIATPHIAGSTHEAQDAVGYQIAMQVLEYLKRGVIQNAVNVPSVSYEEYVEMQPYIVLAERLGSFVAQAVEGSAHEVALRYSGAIASLKTDLLRNAAVKGVLNSVLAEKANLVNAATIAEGRGIRISESGKGHVSGGAAGSVLSVTLHTTTGEHLVKGTVLHGKSPRLLFVDGIDVEAPLERNLIYLRNRDVPGVIGRIGTILGQHKINIANFSLGRQENHGHGGRSGAASVETAPEAVSVVHVDSRVPEEVLKKLLAIPAMTVARSIRL